MAKIVSIKSLGKQKVYDIGVDQYHNYMANGIVVHNCMKIAQVYAGFSLAEADNLRKAIGKKIPEKMAEAKKNFLEKSVRDKGRTAEEAEKVFSYVEAFARYGFNLSVDKHAPVYIIGKGNIAMEDVQPGDFTQCMDEDTGKLTHTEVIGNHDHGEMIGFEVVFDDGSSEVCSINHKFMTQYGQIPLDAILHLNLEVIGNEGKIRNMSGVWEGIAQNENATRSSEKLSTGNIGFKGEQGCVRTLESEKSKFSINSGTESGESYKGFKTNSCRPEYKKDTFENHVEAEQDSGFQGQGFCNCNSDFVKTGNTKTESFETQRVEGKVSGENAKHSRKTNGTSEEFKGGSMAESEPYVPEWIRKEYPDKVWDKTKTGRFCQAWLLGGSGRMLAFWDGLYREAIFSSSDSCERCDVKLGSGTQECYTRSVRDGLFLRKWEEDTEKRMARFINDNHQETIARGLSFRRIVSVRNVGVRHMRDLEVCHKSHNFFLSNGILTSNSHAVSYAKITFQAGYLKAYYPTEYMCELLNGEISASPGAAKIEMYTDEARFMGIRVNRPSVMDGGTAFRIREDGSIDFGLGFIKHVGAQAAKEALKMKGHFTSLTMFLAKTSTRILNERAIKSMIAGGAFDFTGLTRNVLFEKYQAVGELVHKYKDQQKRKKEGVKLRTELTLEEIAVIESGITVSQHPLTMEQLLDMEHEVLGAFISQSPTAPFEHIIREKTNTDVFDIMEGDMLGKDLCFAARINDIRTHIVKKGDNAGKEMAFVNVSYHSCDVDAMVFTATYAKLKQVLKIGKIYIFKGESERRAFLSITDAELLSQT